MPAEAQALLGRHISPNTVTPFAECLLIASGMGSARATDAARRLVKAGARALVSWGTAGALAAHLRPGTLLLPRAVSSHDQRRYTVDNVWRTRLHDRLNAYLTIDTGVITSSDAIIDSPEAKSAMLSDTGAAAVDMESAAIAEVAQAASVPLLIVRAVADTASLSVPTFIADVTDEYGKLRVLPFAGAVLREPSVIPRLLALRQAWNAALRTLRTVARVAAAELAASE
jgi:adenosylhomocysteine nucleosidase